MGCGSSSESAPTSPQSSKNKVQPGDLSSHQASQNGGIVNNDTQKDKSSTPKKNKGKEKNNNIVKEEKKSVAFEIGFENNIDSIINKHPPKRLQRLAPLPESAPTLSPEELQEKIRQAEDKAEQNRTRELEKKKEVSRRSLKLRQEIMRAREMEKAQEEKELEEKQQSASRAREQKQKQLEEKKRLREERARKAKERAKKMKEDGAEDLDYELEKDDAFNQDDKDSWLDGDNNTSDYHTDNDRFNSGTGDRIYSGRESPQKSPGRAPPGGGDSHKQRGVSAFSASTADSFEYAYQRNPQLSGKNTNNDARYDRTQVTDDFFDS